MPKVAGLNALYPTNCPVLLRVREDFSTWNWTYHKDYIRYNLRGALFYEHQLVVAYGFHNGPSTVKNHAHHKDTNRLNNSFSNLTVLSDSEHLRIHREGSGHIELCANCQKPKKCQPSKAKQRKNVFCSRKCYLDYLQKNKQESEKAGKNLVLCKGCNKRFKRNSYNATRHISNYCSNECFHAANRKHKRPSPTELTELLAQFSYDTN